MTTLVIVESPGKTKTIKKYLDSLWPNKYEVEASYGHVCDLSVKSLGFDPNTFEGHYEVSEDKQRVVKNLKAIAKRSEDVILAMDNDREGEAIAYHLMRELKLNNPDRILFNEITKPAVEKAMKSPTKINNMKVYAQETRRLLDRMIGWLVSPVARNYVVPDSSMGRVQTVIVYILVLLERRIRTFVSVKHYNVTMMMLNNDKDPIVPWSAEWEHKPWRNPQDKVWTDKTVAEKIRTIKSLVVDEIIIGEATNNPPAPLITSTLQRAAEINLGLSPKETMVIAQKLYEAGAITYMRTDNPNLSAEAFIAVKSYAQANDLPIEPAQRMFNAKKNAQEAHEAIRPTSFALLKVSDGKMQDVYELIWNRAVASQLKAAKYDTKEVVLSQSVEVTINGETSVKKAIFKAKGRRLTYAGWRDLTKNDFSEIEQEDREDNNDLSNLIPESLKVGDVVEVKDTQLQEKNTEPPRRFTAAGLVAELERCGIGRPSTYASLMDTILKRGFIRYEKKKIYVTDNGFKIIDTMENHFSFIDVQYTADMETELDNVESGVKQYKPVLKSFWQQVNGEVSAFEKHIISTLPQHKCEECQSLVMKRVFKGNIYWKCSNAECAATYADKNNAPGNQQINKATSFKCIECERPLTYSKGAFRGSEYEYFVCTGKADTQNPCTAKYSPILNSKPATPDYERYKEETKHKCLLCKRPIIKRVSEKDGLKRVFWVCTGNRKESPLCSAFYDDKNGVPDFEAFQLNHKFNCKKCGNFIQRRKKRDSDSYFWVCGHQIDKNEKCNTFYEDKDKAPDFEKYESDYKLNHTYKCINGSCTNFLSRRKYKEKDQFYWVCECKAFYDDVDMKPDYEQFKISYERNHTHKCIADNCKDGYLARFDKKDGNGHYWKCASCSAFYYDENDLPDIEKYRTDHTYKCFSCQNYMFFFKNVAGVSKWKCSEDTCGIPYDDIDGKPDYQKAQETFKHQCSNCRFGKLKSIISPKTKKKQWVCQNQHCNKYYDDNDGIPNQTSKKKG